jgi:hypothetical protein
MGNKATEKAVILEKNDIQISDNRWTLFSEINKECESQTAIHDTNSRHCYPNY